MVCQKHFVYNSGIYKTTYNDGSYLERDNDKVLKLHTNNFCYFEIGGPLQSFEIEYTSRKRTRGNNLI